MPVRRPHPTIRGIRRSTSTDTRKNDTHQSTTDPDAQLYRKGNGKEAKLAYLGHVLLDNRHGLAANVCTTAATGTGEWEVALLLLEQAAHATTVGGDKHFDVDRFVTPARQLGITPHVAPFQFTEPRGGWSVREIQRMLAARQTFRAHAFDFACAQHGIDHRLTKFNHPWTNGQVKRMNRTIKDAAVLAGSSTRPMRAFALTGHVPRRLQLREAP
jgi:hypothetical protein